MVSTEDRHSGGFRFEGSLQGGEQNQLDARLQAKGFPLWLGDGSQVS